MSHEWTPWAGGETAPVNPATPVQVIFRNETPETFDQEVMPAGGVDWRHTGSGRYDVMFYRIADVGDLPPAVSEPAVPVTSPQDALLLAKAAIAEAKVRIEMSEPNGPSAPDLLDKAAGHMRDRAAIYDKPEGERSMAATVQAFNAITARDLRESEGWLLMSLLKLVRSETRDKPHQDSIEDNIAYAGLYGEARLAGR